MAVLWTWLTYQFYDIFIHIIYEIISLKAAYLEKEICNGYYCFHGCSNLKKRLLDKNIYWKPTQLYTHVVIPKVTTCAIALELTLLNWFFNMFQCSTLHYQNHGRKSIISHSTTSLTRKVLQFGKVDSTDIELNVFARCKYLLINPLWQRIPKKCSDCCNKNWFPINSFGWLKNAWPLNIHVVVDLLLLINCSCEFINPWDAFTHNRQCCFTGTVAIRHVMSIWRKRAEWTSTKLFQNSTI